MPIVKKKKTRVKKGSTRSPRFSAHGAGLMIETIRDDVKLVAESVVATREALEEALEKESTGIRGIIMKETADIRGEIRQVQSGLEKKIDGVEEKLEKKIDETRKELKQEILTTKQELKAEIRSALIPVNTRLDRHEEQITLLKEARA